MDFRGVLRRHIAPIVLSCTIGGSVLSGIPINVNASETSSVVYDENIEKTNESELFQTEKEALLWLSNSINSLKENYQIINTNISIYKGVVSKTYKTLINETYNIEEEAINRLNELEEDEYYNSTVLLNEVKEKRVYNQKKYINRVFNTEDELEKYKELIKEKDNLYFNVFEVYSNSEMDKKMNLYTYNNMPLNIDLDFIFKKEYLNLNKNANLGEKKYLIIGLYDEKKEEIITLYNLSGEMFRRVSYDRYKAKITYKHISKEMNKSDKIMVKKKN